MFFQSDCVLNSELPLSAKLCSSWSTFFYPSHETVELDAYG
jgi:hypothetical protein